MKCLENILEVRIGGEVFGFDADAIEQILIVPPITPMPLSDSSMLGVAVLSGKITHAIDLGSAIGSSSANTQDEKARLLTLSCQDCHESFVVDEVLDMIDIDEQRLEENHEQDSFLVGFYKTDEHVVQILSVEALLGMVDIAKFEPAKIDSLQENSETQNQNQESGELMRALFFRAGEERFAIDIEALRELIFAPEDITPISGSDALGMITLRDEVIALLDMDMLLGFASKAIDEKSRALIAYHEGKTVAFLVDEVEEVKTLEQSQLEEMPGGIASDMIASIYKERRSVASLLASGYIRGLVREYVIHHEEQTNQTEEETKESNMSEVAVFKVADEEYAFDIEEVQEIIRYDTITPVPEAPGYMEGILNLRGSVIPVVSLPDRLGFSYEADDKTKIVVCSVGSEKIGFVVDDVNEILFVEDNYISKSTDQEALFEEVINLDDGKRVILKIKVKNLLDEETLSQMKMIEK